MEENSYLLTNQNTTSATNGNTDDEIIGKSAREEIGKLKSVDKKNEPESPDLLQLEAGSRCISSFGGWLLTHLLQPGTRFENQECFSQQVPNDKTINGRNKTILICSIILSMTTSKDRPECKRD